MTPQEYQELLGRIEAAYQRAFETAQRAIADAETRRAEQLAAAETIWSVLHDGQPPTIERARLKGRPPQAANGDAPTSQRRRIRAIIDALPSTVDSAAVRRRYGEIYPDDPQLDSSTVMKIIRELAKMEWLTLVSEAGFQTPATFEKTANYGREN